MSAAAPPMFAPDLWSALQRRAGAADRDNPVVTDCAVVPVTAAARAQAPVVRLSEQVPAPPPGDLPAHRAALSAVRGAGHVAGIDWPVCCGRLAVLHFLHGGGASLDGAIDAALLDGCVLGGGDVAAPAERGRWADRMGLVRKRRHGGDGMALLRCADCARVYGAWAIP